jgi:hypothetical protein
MTIQSFAYVSFAEGRPATLNLGAPPMSGSYTFVLLLRLNGANNSVASATDNYGSDWLQATGAAKQTADGSYDCWYVEKARLLRS